MRWLLILFAFLWTNVSANENNYSCYGDLEVTREQDGKRKTIPVKINGSFKLTIKGSKMEFAETMAGTTTTSSYVLIEDNGLYKGESLNRGSARFMNYWLEFNPQNGDIAYSFEGGRKGLLYRKDFKGKCK